MGSLTSCGKKAGAAWSPESRRIVLARAAELKRGGASAQDAARMAINERMASVREMLRDAMKAPAPAPAPIKAAAPVAEPAPAPAPAVPQEAAAEPRRVESLAEQNAEAPAAQPAQEAVAPSQAPAAAQEADAAPTQAEPPEEPAAVDQAQAPVVAQAQAQPAAEKAEEAAPAPPAATAAGEFPLPLPIKESDIPYDVAYAAHRNTSHVPEERARQRQKDYVAQMEDAWRRGVKAAGSDAEAVSRVSEAFKELAGKYRAAYVSALEASSRTASSMITGPARFNVERNRKANDVADKRAAEARDVYAKGVARMLKAAAAPVDNSPQGELDRIKANIASREAEQQRMKAANAALRRDDDAALRALGFTGAEIAKLKAPDFAGRTGFPAYAITNNGAEIRRLRDRLNAAEQRVAATAKPAVDREVAGVRVEEDAEADRLKLFFHDKPDTEVRDLLKASGFRWAPSTGAWQRQLTDNARRAAEAVLAKIGRDNTDEAPATPFSRRADADALDAEARALQAISENDDLFALPKSEKTTLEGIAADNDPGIKVVKNSTVGNQTFYTLTLPSGKTARLTVREGNPYGPSLYGFDLVDGEMTNQVTERPGENADYVSPRTGDVWIDVSLLTQRGEGRLVYNIAATLAHNTDRVFIGDPAGLSDEAMRRRPEQMLSSALKFGTTDHLAPHPRQVAGDAKIGVPPLRWVYGDDLANIRALIDLNLAAIDNAFPSAKNLGYDIATGQFVNAATGRPVDDRRLADRMGAGRGRGIAQAALAGSRTVKRAAVFRSLLREEGGGRGGPGRRNGLLARLAGQRSSLAYADPDQRIFYSRSTVAPEVAARVSAVTELAERIAARWARAPEIVVVADMNDPAVPQAVRDIDEAQRSQGASGEPEGFFHGGKVYLVASQLRGDADTVRVLFHEALGHYGLRGTFGDALGPMLDQMAALRASEVRAKAEAYGLDYENPAARRLAAEEVLAEMAQVSPRIGWVQRAVSAIRNWLRSHVPGFGSLRLTDDDIIQRFILPARAFVERGGPGGPGGGGLPAFSKAQSPDSEAFKRWFGDSKVVDAEGRPLVVYHGTGSDIESFSKDKSRDVGFHFGDVVAANYVMERERMKDPGARPNALPVYLSIRNPLRVADTNFSPFQFPAALARQVGDGSGISANDLRDLADSLDALRGKPDAMRRAARQVMDFLESKGYDGLQYQNKKEGRGVSWAAFRPEQIKSATGNSGAFDPADPRIAFSRSAAEVLRGVDQKAIRNAFLDAVTSHGSVNLWERTVGTQYALAKKHPDTYGRVFDAVQDYLKDASAFANTAADAAPSLLPKLERMADLWKDGILRHGADPKDVERASAAIFEGTLEDTIFADDELRTRFGLTDGQIGLYREFRAAVDRSLTDMAKTEMVRIAGKEGERVAQATMAAETVGDAARIMREHLEALAEAQKRPALLQRADEIDGKADAVRGLMDRGYAPLMRFGRHTVTVTDPQGEVLFFSMHESTREANAAARELGEDPAFAGATITQGVMSQEGFRLFNGLSLDSLELFAEATGNADNEVVQAYLKLATSTRSALRRMIHRKGTAGYSSNATRVLATFVTSNARLAAGNLHLGDARKAADAIPKEQGDLKDQAVKLVDYVTNPQEEAAAARGLLFTTFIGGSVASAAVNLTQPLTMTLPWLSQFGGVAQAGRRLLAAAATAASGRATGDMAKALARAEHEGIVSPQEIHHLQAEAMGALGKHPVLKKAAFLWGSLFSLSEQFNRRVSFIAAYQTAVEQGIDDPFMFAEQTVNETQGLYNKGNKANWARGAIGATLMTFKQFSVHYLEFLTRMWKSGPEGKKAVGVALAMLLLAAGADGLPFADDLNDVIDTIGQALGYDTNSKRWKRRFIAETLGLGDTAAEAATRGLTALPGMPVDLSLRMGLGNLLPATGLLLRSKTDTSGDLLEIAGAAGGLAKKAMDGAGKALQGDVLGAGEAVAPLAIQNMLKGIRMGMTGDYRDTKGRKVMDVDAIDAGAKFLGFQPAAVAHESSRIGETLRTVQLARNVESQIAVKWAQAAADGDSAGVQAARDELAAWNEKNPEARIRITPIQIRQRVAALRSNRADRTVKAAPKELRGLVAEGLK